ncbi:SDR family oxidoreductase [Vacuolonema iberomarrocanum]|uniref:SDR family oxidoreductase n=1 Tax=Vacuolonema iberomarrocanum TaxID=3454632 RepID=UPI0019EA5D50|nr:SDR family oxidoreductase [filamentous cyanobacterium LEGE 07170]
MRLKGSTVLCVGGSSGMGRGVAEVALAEGAEVIVTSRTLEKAQKTAQELGCHAEAIDVADDESVQQLFARLDKVTHMMITAGAIGRSAFDDTPPDQAPVFMDGKLWATHRCIWYSRSVMDQQGSITLITGGYAQWATPDAAHVHVAFAATEALARTVAVSLAPIRCNVIRPGFVDSALWDYLDDGDRTALKNEEREQTLTGELVSPQDIGDVAVALMTTRAVTGAVIPVDGGRHLKPIS